MSKVLASQTSLFFLSLAYFVCAAKFAVFKSTSWLMLAAGEPLLAIKI